MKSVYWRPNKVSRTGLVLVAVASLVGLAFVLSGPWPRQHAVESLARQAADRAATMMDSLKAERLRRGVPLEPALDPGLTGLVGAPMSVVTSRPADLRSKQTSVNPNFAAAVVSMLTAAGVQRGDVIAIGWSGSFPALNLSVAAAVETLELEPLIIASAASSQYGANFPNFMWLDMERCLRDQGLLRCQSAWLSMGAGADRGLGLSDDGRLAIEQLAARHGVPMLRSDSREAAIEDRMQRYQQLAVDRPIRAYINVGGGVASTGGERAKHRFRPGLNRHVRIDDAKADCVMARFSQQGIPVLHLIEAKQLAARYGMPEAPEQRPAAGGAQLADLTRPSRVSATLVLVGLLLGMRSCVLRPHSARVHEWLQRCLGREIGADAALADHDANEDASISRPQLMV